jgi:hypothetical protein
MAGPAGARGLTKQLPNTSAPIISIEHKLTGELCDGAGKPITGTLKIAGNITHPWRYLFGALTQSSSASGGAASSSPGPAALPTQSWFVSATGSDSNNGQSSGAAFATIQKALDTILSFDLGGTGLVTLNVGAGTFAGWSLIGPARGWTGDQQTGAPLGAASILVLGAGSGLTNINHMTSNAKLCIGNSGGLYIALQAMNINVVGASGGDGINCNTYAILSLNGDISFTGSGDGTGHAIFADSNGFIFNSGAVTLKGTLASYFDSSNTANYESIGGSVVVAGTVATFTNMEVLANMHGETVSVAGGTTTAVAYALDTNSVLSMATSLTGVWSQLGVLSNGARTEGACNAPAVTGSSGLGTGSAAIAAGSDAYALQVVLSPTGVPGSSGTVQVQINEKLTLNQLSFSPYVVTPAPGSGTWSAVTAWISAIVQSATNVKITISWFNNSVNLVAGQTYALNLIGQT